jgi:hypothetical protein
MAWGEAELEPEVRDWLEGLDDQRWAQAMFHLDLLEERGALLGEPYTRQLAGKLRGAAVLLRRAAGADLVLDRAGAEDHHADGVHQDQDAGDR